LTAHCGPDVIKYQDMQDPEPGAGDVLVRVASIGINPEDMLVRNGETVMERTDAAGNRMFRSSKRRGI
jgi:NADPH:quinone reductase-like Zn-dependent oxidoreductase